jgi:hypothetical protein
MPQRPQRKQSAMYLNPRVLFRTPWPRAKDYGKRQSKFRQGRRIVDTLIAP